ncbi:MAG: hypothetical protein ACK5OB_20370 [Pirellula sp.]
MNTELPLRQPLISIVKTNVFFARLPPARVRVGSDPFDSEDFDLESSQQDLARLELWLQHVAGCDG